MKSEKKLDVMIVILLFLVLLMIPATANAATCKCGNPYCVYNAKTERVARKRIMRLVNKYVRRGKAKNCRVEFITSERLTARKLETRKGKIIYIEVCRGYVMNKNYDGIQANGYYISYRRIDDRLKKGNCIMSYFIYNPLNNYIDDIMYRTDRVLNTNKNKAPIRKAKKIFKNRFGYDYEERR